MITLLFQYKYQLNIDGTVAAYRFPYLMAGGSLIFKQDSGYYEHFYKQLVPWEHYVPVQNDLGDLLERVEWARSEDARAEEMAWSAAEFVRTHLLPHHLYCYIFKLLQVIRDLLHLYNLICLYCTYNRSTLTSKWVPHRCIQAWSP